MGSSLGRHCFTVVVYLIVWFGMPWNHSSAELGEAISSYAKLQKTVLKKHTVSLFIYIVTKKGGIHVEAIQYLIFL